MQRSESTTGSPLFAVADLNAFYAGAHVLHAVSFSMGSESVAIIGRNGMTLPTVPATDHSGLGSGVT